MATGVPFPEANRILRAPTLEDAAAVTGLHGLRLIKDSSLVVDNGKRSWARVRSPSRARRRLAMGFRQNIDVIWEPRPEIYQTADMLIGHPVVIAELLRQVEEASRARPVGVSIGTLKRD